MMPSVLKSVQKSV